MLATLISLALAPVAAGAYPMPELCRILTEATGKPHYADADLKDYPVFVSVKDGDPERVRTLVAAALRAAWTFEDGKYRLKWTKPDFDAEFPEFERQLKAAVHTHKTLASIPAKDLYMMPSGSIIRYGSPSNQYIKPLPPALLQRAKGGDAIIVIRRFTAGLFEHAENIGGETQGVFNSGAGVEFNTLPPDVEKLVQKDLDKLLLTPEEQEAMQRGASVPGGLNVDFSNLSKRDPVSDSSKLALPALASKLSCDLAVALHDMTLFMIGSSGGMQTPSVRAFMAKFSGVVDWAVVDGAAVAKLPISERISATQSKRDVLGRLYSAVKAEGIANADALSYYVANQRPAASNSWADAMLLVIAGIVLDSEFIGDYPFNMRLYSTLQKSDWALLEAGQPFSAGRLSPAAQQALLTLLLQARTRLEDRDGMTDPATWPSLDMRSLIVVPKLENEPVLIGWTGMAASVDSVRHAAANFDMRRKEMGKDPNYQPAIRRKLSLTIQRQTGEHVKTGFTEVLPDKSVKPSVWEKLPAAIAEEFKAALAEYRKLIPPHSR